MSDLKSRGMAMVVAMTHNDSSGMREVLHPDVVWRYPESTRLSGFDPIRKGADEVVSIVAQAFKGAFRQPLEPVVEVLLQDGEYVMILAQLQGQTFSGLPYDNRYIFLMRFRGEHIVEGWEMPDMRGTPAMSS